MNAGITGVLAGLAAALFAAAASSAAPASETPAQFVQRVYAIYRSDSPWWNLGEGKAEKAYQNRAAKTEKQADACIA
ncbi:MAG TPA: hypothetical protein VN805_05720 [Caulobacteraceae bacterium]|nr:hypothetical protein [Caulobacteraceae bacterium]